MAESPPHPRRIVVAAIAGSVAGGVMVLLGFAEFALTSWSGLLGASGGLMMLGAVMLGSGIGLYFQSGLARVASVVFSVLAVIAAVFVIAASETIWISIAASVVFIAGVLVAWAVATTASWHALLGNPRQPPPPISAIPTASSEPSPSPIGTFLQFYVLGWTAVGLVGYGIAFLATLFESGPSTAVSQLGWPAAWAFIGILMFREAPTYGTGPRRRLNLALAIPGVPALLLGLTVVSGPLFSNLTILNVLGIDF